MKFYEDLYIPIFVRYNNKKNRYEWYIASNEQKDLMNSNIIPKPEPDVININLYEPRINKLKKKPLILRLTQNDNNINYYDGMVADLVTLHEQFTQDKWTPVCLPFEVSKSILSVNGWSSRVHEFRYIENGQLYVATTDNMEAGKAYIMNANARLAAKDEHYLGSSLIDTSADKVMNLRCASDYDGLDGYKSSGDFEIAVLVRDADKLKKDLPVSRIFELNSSFDDLNSFVEDFRPDAIFHLFSLFIANHRSEDIIPLIQSNIEFGSLLLETAANARVKYFINIGITLENF